MDSIYSLSKILTDEFHCRSNESQQHIKEFKTLNEIRCVSNLVDSDFDNPSMFKQRFNGFSAIKPVNSGFNS